jgi:hypothetical protein
MSSQLARKQAVVEYRGQLRLRVVLAAMAQIAPW